MEIRRKSLVVLLGIGIAGIVGASAASLNLTTSSLGADADIVAACDSDGIAASFTYGYSPTVQEYTVSQVVLTGVAAGCNGLPLAMTLTLTDPADPTNTSTVAFSGTAATGTTNVAVSPAVSAEWLTNLAVVIAG